MPPLRLTILLRSLLPGLSNRGAAVVSTLGCLNGHPRSATDVAAWLGMANRFELARLLRREGLPPLRELIGCARVLHWLSRSETTGASLRQLALEEHTDPAVAYRLVRRVLRRSWEQARRDGLPAAVSSLRHHARPEGGREAGLDLLKESARETAGHPDRRRTPPAIAPTDGERVPITGSPFDVAIVGEVALITRLHAASVEAVNLASDNRTTIHTGPVPTRIVVGLTPQRVFVTHQFTGQLGEIDLEAGRIVRSLPVPGDAMAAVVAPGGRSVYVTTNLDQLCAVSLASGRVTATVTVPQVCNQLGINPTGSFLYVPTWTHGSIVEVDARTFRPGRTFVVGGVAQDIVVSSDQVLFAANEAGWLDVIALTSGSHVARIQLGAPAFALALSPDERRLLVSLVATGQVVVVDRDRLALEHVIPVGGRPRRLAVVAGGRRVAVANEAGWLDLLDVPAQRAIMTFGASHVATGRGKASLRPPAA